MPKSPRFHLQKTSKGEWRPYLRAANGEYVGGTETYGKKQEAKSWAKKLPGWAAKALALPFIEDDSK